MVNMNDIDHNIGQMTSLPTILPVLERQLMLQLGDRLRQLRKARGLTTVVMAQRVGVSRTTLAAVEAGDPAPSMGTYVRVMAVLGVAGDLALLATDTLQPAPAGSAGARSRRGRPTVQVLVASEPGRHETQDLQSLALHEAAIRAIKHDPALIDRAQDTLQRWRSSGESRSAPLWDEWAQILARRTWRKALSRTQRAQELRQASPLPTLLTDDQRRSVLAQAQALRQGVTLGDVQGKDHP